MNLSLQNNSRKVNFFIGIGALSGLAGVVARALSSHTLKTLLEERNSLENFNLAADYLVLHGLALIAIAILLSLFPTIKYHRAGILFLLGTLLFQGSVLVKSFISIEPFGFLTPLGGLFLMLGWILIIVSSCALPVKHNGS